MTPLGLYEQLINKLVSSKLNDLDRNTYYIKESEIDKREAARLLSQYLVEVIRFALNLISGDDSIEKQIKLSNKLIFLLQTELQDLEFDKDLIDTRAKILSAIFLKTNAGFSDFEKHLKGNNSLYKIIAK